MGIDVEKQISQGLSCAQTKGTPSTAPNLEYHLPAGPFDAVGIDHLQLPRSTQGSVYILVCVDHFSGFVVLAPLLNKSALTVAHAIVSYLICPYTTPRVLISDNGMEFKNQILADICSQYNIKQTFITVHHPASNCFAERTNRKYLRSYGTLQDTYRKPGKIDFRKSQLLLMAVNSSTEKTHHYIIF